MAGPGAGTGLRRGGETEDHSDDYRQVWECLNPQGLDPAKLHIAAAPTPPSSTIPLPLHDLRLQAPQILLLDERAYSPIFAGSSPQEYAVWVPARRAYSHSASVGSR